MRTVERERAREKERDRGNVAFNHGNPLDRGKPNSFESTAGLGAQSPPTKKVIRRISVFSYSNEAQLDTKRSEMCGTLMDRSYTTTVLGAVCRGGGHSLALGYLCSLN